MMNRNYGATRSSCGGCGGSPARPAIGAHPRAPRATPSCGCGMNRARAESVTNQGNTCVNSCDQRACNGRCKQLMDQIRAVDFAMYETILYLDVYPHSCDALETYHKLKAQREALHREYESLCGPLTAFGNQSTTSWDWMSKPFPWEYDAD